MKALPPIRALAMALLTAIFATASTSAMADVRPPAEVVHRLGFDARQLRFEGEWVAKTWPIYVTADEAQTRARVRLSYTNAISVMPELSSLAIYVNDIEVARQAIAAASDPADLDVELPRGLLVEGFNALRVAVTQRHRVDCSLPATYELWTQLDPAMSGLVFPGLAGLGLASLDDLAAISPDPGGATPIRAVLAPGASEMQVNRVFHALEGVAVRAGLARPQVEIASAFDARPGLWLVAGVNADLRAELPENLMGTASGARLVTDDKGRAIVVVSGDTDADFDAAVAELLPSRASDAEVATASAARARANAGGYPVVGGTHTRLGDLGLQTEEFNGRLLRAGFDIQLPPDFYPADYDKLTISLSAGYSAGLASGAQVLVRVNDREAGSLPMKNPKGELFRDRAIAISLSALRPGLNHVVIEAQTPAPEDEACEMRSLMSAKKRFVLSEDSELIMPGIARIVRMPNLAVTLSSGYPYAGDPRSRIILAARDPATLAAAATFLARAAFVSRQILAASVSFDFSDAESASVMIFGGFDKLDASVVERFGIDAAALKTAWARRASLETPAATAHAASKPAEIGDAFDEWAQRVRDVRSDFGPRASLRAIYDRYINVHRADFAWLRDTTVKLRPSEKARLLLSQARAPKGSGVWTLVTAPNADGLQRDMFGLVAPSSWSQVEGRAAVYEPKTGIAMIGGVPDTWFVQTASLSPGNIRLIAAGYLSSSIDDYVFVVVIGALLLGGLTTWTVRSFGMRP